MIIKKTINLVVEGQLDLFSRQQPEDLNYEWIYSNQPEEADVHVIYGFVKKHEFRNKSSFKMFITIEPPEILTYDLNVLKQYDLVIGGEFAYLGDLPNFRANTGILNWSVGIDHASVKPTVSKTYSEITNLEVGNRNERISVVTSRKAMTPLQRKRLEFIEFLDKRLPLTLYGNGLNPVGDKLEGLIPHRYHLALENSSHMSFWTEKLSDPILALARTFYSGAPNINAEFDNAVIQPINLDNFEASYRTIEKSLSANEINYERIKAARDYIAKEKNFHKVVENVILKTPDRALLGSSLTSIPKHKVSLGDRTRYTLDRLKRW